MATHAPIRTAYSVRILIISLALIGGGLWFLYDGMVVYPRRQQMYETYQEIREAHPTQWQRQWQQRAEEEDWPSVREPEEYTDGQILTQRVFAAILLPMGALIGVMYVRLLGRWIRSDEAGLRTSWGAHAPWSAIESLDKSRWQRKGIAVVHYTHEGASGRIKLDDWKYDTAAIEQMVSEVETTLAQRQGTDTATDAGEQSGAEAAETHD